MKKDDSDFRWIKFHLHKRLSLRRREPNDEAPFVGPSSAKAASCEVALKVPDSNLRHAAVAPNVQQMLTKTSGLMALNPEKHWERVEGMSWV